MIDGKEVTWKNCLEILQTFRVNESAADMLGTLLSTEMKGKGEICILSV